MPLPDRRRDTARVIVAGPDDRALLFRYMLPRPWARAGWMLPGGAIDPGETAAQTAVRELAEETGHVLSPTQIGAAVATDSGQWHGADGAAITTVNWYYFVRVVTAAIDTSGQADTERCGLLGYRWWAIAELSTTPDLVLPVGLAGLLARLLAGDTPRGPLRLAWGWPPPPGPPHAQIPASRSPSAT
jgi:8-oxo-dGTP pyrophosphatase MutT (NUDIX family)